jgi:hypothetical protein
VVFVTHRSIPRCSRALLTAEGQDERPRALEMMFVTFVAVDHTISIDSFSPCMLLVASDMVLVAFLLAPLRRNARIPRPADFDADVDGAECWIGLHRASEGAFLFLYSFDVKLTLTCRFLGSVYTEVLSPPQSFQTLFREIASRPPRSDDRRPN